MMQEGTYSFDSLINRETEFKRLLSQAMVLPDVEIEVMKKHGLRAEIDMLDAACGPGVIACFIAEQFKGARVTGVDLNESLLDAAKKMAAERKLQVEFLKGDIYNLPFENKFDFIYCRFLFQHLDKPETAFASLRRSLKPGGRLCILDVDDNWLSLYPEVPAFTEICRKASDCQAKAGGDRFVGRKLRSYFKAAGLDNIKVDIVTANSEQIGIEQFINITTGFKTEILHRAGDDSGEQRLDEVRKASVEQDLFGIVGVFAVSGMKQ